MKLFLIFLIIGITIQKSNVYFTKIINPSSIVNLYKRLNIELKGNVALKVHSGERGGKYFLTPNFLQEIYDYTKGTFVECNTAYKSRRHTTELHKELLKEHGWLDNNRRFVLMDENPEKDFKINIKNGEKISENIVGEHLKEFDSCLVLSHVKGHMNGGFGGALKQLSIGFASQAGKSWIHTAGVTSNWTERFIHRATQEDFTASMGDAASSIVEYFRSKGKIAFINVIANISKYCDCTGGLAPPPKIHDIGILASTDPVAIDRASLDLINQTNDEGTKEWFEQLADLKGENTIFVAERHKIGTQEYNLIDIDRKSDVYFTRNISPLSIVELYKKLNIKLSGNIGLKVHSGEKGGKYFLTPTFLREIYEHTHGKYIECNTAYENMRHSTDLHKKLLYEHGWYDNEQNFIIMDEDPSSDFKLEINNAEKISENYVGGHLKEFDSSLVLSHVKGHPSGGFGGALKQLSIGFASQAGKTWIHTAGTTLDWKQMKYNRANQENFTTSMGDAASSIVGYFRDRGGIAFINVIANISLMCDCAGGRAPEPKIHDIGILASTDPVAIDRASIDLIKQTKDEGTEQWIKQLETLKGENTIDVAERHGIGSQKYNLIDIDKKSDVYFTKNISPSKMVELFKKLNVKLPGNVGLKVHSGEDKGKYFLTPNFLQEIYDYTKGTFIECNTAYKNRRHTTELHKELLKEHGWLDNNRKFVIMDENPEKDFKLSITNPEKIVENIVGEHLNDFDSCVVLSHVKGHGMGGFGGALKQLSIGFASQAGKAWIHSAGDTDDWTKLSGKKATQEDFTTSMGDAASSIVEYFKNKGEIAYISVLANISKSCDCAGGRAPEPKIHDIGILASLDPVAIDRAAIDLINKTQDIGTEEWMTQLNKLLGMNTIDIAEKHNIGTQKYNLISIDKEEPKEDEIATIDFDSQDSLFNALNILKDKGGNIYIDTPEINIFDNSLMIVGNKTGGIIGLKQKNGEYPRLNFKNAQNIKVYSSGIIISGSNHHLKNLIIENSNGNGISIFGEKNLFEHIITRYNQHNGIRIWENANDNIFNYCYSYRNMDLDTYGQFGNGFALYGGNNNQFNYCFAFDNSNSGFRYYNDVNDSPKIKLSHCSSWNNGNPKTFTGEYDFINKRKLDSKMRTVQELIETDPSFEFNYENENEFTCYGVINDIYIDDWVVKVDKIMIGNGIQFGVKDSKENNDNIRIADYCITFDNKANGFDNNFSKKLNAEFSNCVSFNNNINYVLPYYFKKWDNMWSWKPKESDQKDMDKTLFIPFDQISATKQFYQIREAIMNTLFNNKFDDSINFDITIKNLE